MTMSSHVFNKRELALRSYYLSTPLFILLDEALHVSIRACFLEGQGWFQYVYYLGAFLVGVIGYRSVLTMNVMGLLDGVYGITTLTLAVLNGVFQGIAFGTGESTTAPVIQDGYFWVNYLIVGTFLLVSLYKNPLWSRGILQ